MARLSAYIAHRVNVRPIYTAHLIPSVLVHAVISHFLIQADISVLASYVQHRAVVKKGYNKVEPAATAFHVDKSSSSPFSKTMVACICGAMPANSIVAGTDLRSCVSRFGGAVDAADVVDSFQRNS